uniref:Hypothetical conserved protein n=1 Tax=Acetithermum autotrophicum TaxID=1446466 RepID=H5SU16_ACEAU|nr:hypothetical conserved protein [Candidatus Acetothermum autotrophicum]
MNNQIALITGSNSGIGLATSLYLARRGFTVWATMRNVEKAGELHKAIETEKLPIEIARLDVCDDESVQSAVAQVLQKSGRIDVVVNNAGYGLRGAVEEVSLDEWKRQFETNFFGVIRVTQAVLPQMRAQRSGAIVNISSVLGRFAIPFSGPYTASKFALEGLTETLRYELGPVEHQSDPHRAGVHRHEISRERAARPSRPRREFPVCRL